MRDTIGDWKNEWIETNGYTHDLEVVIKDRSLDDSASCIYEGSFMDVPEELLYKKVVSCGKIIESSRSERNGAYLLKI